jgi:hypothetical protein
VYFRSTGSTTTDRKKVQRTRFTLDLKSLKGKSYFDKSRMPTLDVDMPNY